MRVSNKSIKQQQLVVETLAYPNKTTHAEPQYGSPFFSNGHMFRQIHCSNVLIQFCTTCTTSSGIWRVKPRHIRKIATHAKPQYGSTSLVPPSKLQMYHSNAVPNVPPLAVSDEWDLDTNAATNPSVPQCTPAVISPGKGYLYDFKRCNVLWCGWMCLVLYRWYFSFWWNGSPKALLAELCYFFL